MDKRSAQRLYLLNTRFYQVHAGAFSETRQAPWPGWRRVLMGFKGLDEGAQGLALCDAACGNGRFEAFALEEYPERPWRFTCIDGNPRLLDKGFLGGLPKDKLACVQQQDLLEGLGRGSSWLPLGRHGPFDAIVSFGFMHHIPGAENRIAFIEGLLKALRPCGMLALSFWRFADNPLMVAKAKAVTERGRMRLGLTMDPGDYLLGWQGDEGTLRYCHSFSSEELEDISKALQSKARLSDRFRSDGRTGELNEYLIFTAGPLLP